MRFSNSTFVQLLKPINRRQFKEIVERHDGNAYDKSFKSWVILSRCSMPSSPAPVGCAA